MTIRVNGNEVKLPEEVTHVGDLLTYYNLQEDQVVVELNHTIVERNLHKETGIQHGDKVELVHFVGGG